MPSSPYVAGDYLDLVVSIVDGAGVAVDLSGLQSARYAITAYGGPTTALVSKSLGAGIVLTDDASGVLTVTLDNGDTGGLVGKYSHELEIIDADGRVVTVMQGEIRIAAQALLPA